MFSKIIFALAMVCVINASVLTASDDDFESEVEASLNRCNVKACDWVCRRLNMTSGSCVEGHCKCVKSPNAVEKPTDLEDLISLIVTVSDESFPNSEDSVSPKACRSDKCNELCRRVKLRGGACIDGRCICNKRFSQQVTVSDESLSNPQDSVSPKACRSDKCNELCQRIKLRDCTCVDGHCTKRFSRQDDLADPAEFGVDNQFLSLQDDTMTDIADTLSLRSCNSVACDDQCRRSGWHSGVCINGQCKCDYFLNSKGAEISLPNFEDSVSPKRCTHDACNEFCRKLQFREGVCDGARCRCIYPNPKEAMNDLDESASLVDNFLSDDFLSTEDESPLNDVTSDENEESNEILSNEEDLIEPAPSACNAPYCQQWCRRLKYTGGWCRLGQCQCF